jgi:hypothetical protein
MEQLDLEQRNPREVDIDGMVDERYGIRYIGKAVQMFDGTWRSLANVHGALCRVEVSLTFGNAVDGTRARVPQD